MQRKQVTTKQINRVKFLAISFIIIASILIEVL